MRTSCFAGLLALAATAAPAAAQAPGLLVGRVVDRAGRPIADVEVGIATLGLAVRSDTLGRFVLADIPSDKPHTFHARKLGYLAIAREAQFAAGQRVEVEVRMERATRLSPVEVRAAASRDAFAARRASSTGYVLGEEEIRRRQAFDVTDLLHPAPGVHVQGAGSRARLVGRGGCRVQVLLDGLPLMLGRGESINTYVQPGELAGLEAYPSGLSAPSDLTVAGRTDCGVVALWTRR